MSIGDTARGATPGNLPSFSESIYAAPRTKETGCVLAYIVLFLVVVAIIVWLILMFMSPSCDGSATLGSGQLDQAKAYSSMEQVKDDVLQGPVVLAIMSNTCPHCLSMQAAFHGAALHAGNNVRFATIEAPHASEFMREHKLYGVPTVVSFQKDAKLSEFKVHTGNRTKSDFLAFAPRV
jgi:thiol-disulfide isomerase/thioredoxin